MNYKKPKFWVIVICIIVGILCITPLLTNPHAAGSTPLPVAVKTPEATANPKESMVTESSVAATDEETDDVNNISFIAPLKNYEVTCAWGCYQGHQAIDMHDPNNRNADVLASADGIVNETGFNSINGNYIMIEHSDGYKTVYAHLKDEITLKIGDEISQGDKIGITGMTGQATGEHVHFFIMKDDLRLSNTMEFIQ